MHLAASHLCHDVPLTCPAAPPTPPAAPLSPRAPFPPPPPRNSHTPCCTPATPATPAASLPSLQPPVAFLPYPCHSPTSHCLHVCSTVAVPRPSRLSPCYHYCTPATPATPWPLPQCIPASSLPRPCRTSTAPLPPLPCPCRSPTPAPATNATAIIPLPHPCCILDAFLFHPTAPLPHLHSTPAIPAVPLPPLFCNPTIPLTHPCRTPAAPLPLIPNPAASLLHPYRTPATHNMSLPYPYCSPPTPPIPRPYHCHHRTPATPTVPLLHPHHSADTPTIPLPHPLDAPLQHLPMDPLFKSVAFTGAQLEGGYLPHHPAIHHLPHPATLHARVPLLAAHGGQKGKTLSMLHALGCCSALSGPCAQCACWHVLNRWQLLIGYSDNFFLVAAASQGSRDLYRDI